MSKRGTPPLVPCLLSVALCHRRTATRPEQSSQAGLACVSGSTMHQGKAGRPLSTDGEKGDPHGERKVQVYGVG